MNYCTSQTFPYGLGHMTYAPIGEERDKLCLPDNPERVGIKEAHALTKFQLGMMLYDMVVGIPGGASQLYRMPDFIEGGFTKELDFDHPCFKTPTGQFLESQIKALTNLDPNERPELDVVKKNCEDFLHPSLGMVFH